MECRADCGACCIAISIGQPFHGMPDGKPAGVPCVHLGTGMVCDLYDDKRRPALCDRRPPPSLAPLPNRRPRPMYLRRRADDNAVSWHILGDDGAGAD